MSEFEFPKNAFFVCSGSKCGKYKDIRKTLKLSIKENSLKNEVGLFKIECSGQCKNAPIVFNSHENEWIVKTTVSKIEKSIKNILQKK